MGLSLEKLLSVEATVTEFFFFKNDYKGIADNPSLLVEVVEGLKYHMQNNPVYISLSVA